MLPAEAKAVVFQHFPPSLSFRKGSPSFLYYQCIPSPLDHSQHHSHALPSPVFKNKMPSSEPTFPSSHSSTTAPGHGTPQRTFCNHSPTSPVHSSVTPVWLLSTVTNDRHVGHFSVLLCVTPSAPLDTADLSLLGAVGPQCPGWAPPSLATLSPFPSLASPLLPDSKIGKLQGPALSPIFSSASIFSPYVTLTFFLITDDAQINPDLSSGQETDTQLLTCYLCLVVSSASPMEPAQKRNSNPSHPPIQHSSSPVPSQRH